jgi:integrase
VHGFRDLRHMCATIVLVASKHPNCVQKPRGHAKISKPLDTSCRVLPGMDGGLGDEMDEAL